jgi:radical SAM protein with 4Fe4S-binding SPASM domain
VPPEFAMTSVPSKFDRQVRNLVLLADDLSSGREEWQSSPYTLEYATNNICNLRCVMCAQHDGVPLKRSSSDLARRVLGEILPEAGILAPIALSEPFAGDVPLYIEQCEEHDVFLNLITNGTLLTEEKLARVLPRTEYMWISIESHKPEIYESLRVRAKFDKVVANVEMAARMGAEHGVPVTLVSILMHPVHEDLSDYVRFFAAKGVRYFHVLELLQTYPRYEQHRLEGVVPIERLLEIRDEVVETARGLGVSVKFEMPPPLGGDFQFHPRPVRFSHTELARRVHGELFRQHGHFCHHVASYVKVEPDGGVFPCCRGPEELRMGNLAEQSFAEIWNGPKYRELRRRMNQGDLPECCRDCSVLVGTPHYRRPDEPSPGARDLAERQAPN